MCNYSDFVEQQGLKKGREEGHLESLSESVANLVRSGHFSIEAALDILKVSADIRSTVKENAEKTQCCRPHKSIAILCEQHIIKIVR